MNRLDLPPFFLFHQIQKYVINYQVNNLHLSYFWIADFINLRACTLFVEWLSLLKTVDRNTVKLLIIFICIHINDHAINCSYPVAAHKVMAVIWPLQITSELNLATQYSTKNHLELQLPFSLCSTQL